MERETMSTGPRSVIGGGAAALIVWTALPAVLGFALTGGAPARLEAQGSAEGRAGARARDSVVLILNSGARMDSVKVLVRALRHEAPGSAAWDALKAKIDTLLPMAAPPMVFSRQMMPIRGWIGINVGLVPRSEMITSGGDDIVRYIAHPLIVSVTPESPAQRAGIVPGDVLMAYNGVDVAENQVNMSRLLVPERKLSVTIRRGDDLKDYSLEVAKAPEQNMMRRLDLAPATGDLPPDFVGRVERPGDGRVPAKALMVAGDNPFFGVFLGMKDGLFGARMSNVGADLARALKLQVGVLVNDVSGDTPAARAGLRAGDVIISAAGQSVTSTEWLNRVVATKLGDRSIELQVVRERKARTITVAW